MIIEVAAFRMQRPEFPSLCNSDLHSTLSSPCVLCCPLLPLERKLDEENAGDCKATKLLIAKSFVKDMTRSVLEEAARSGHVKIVGAALSQMNKGMARGTLHHWEVGCRGCPGA